jgi:hypothetical protein
MLAGRPGEHGHERFSRFVALNMPRVLSHGFVLDARRTTMIVVAVHPDSVSLGFHLDEGNEEFRKFAYLIELSRIEAYGSVSNGVLDRLRRKAQMLGRGSVVIHDFYVGFAR